MADVHVKTLEKTWRWYGPKDPVTLQHVKQAGATGVVTALHEMEIGAVWDVASLQERRRVIEDAGLTWSVVESIPVHEQIKVGGPDRDTHIANYQQSIRNMGAAGVHILCYNFMPVLDWTRTDLAYQWSDGSEALAFNLTQFAAFELHMLQRPGAEATYTHQQKEKAKAYYDGASAEAKDMLMRNIVAGMPGRMVEAYTLDKFQAAIDLYNNVDNKAAKENLRYFLRKVVPVAEEAGVYMAIHPDDPPLPLLGLPRVVSTAEDVQDLLSAADSVHNGLTMCVGTFASRADNDVEGMVERFVTRTNFVHLRNVRKFDGGGDGSEQSGGGGSGKSKRKREDAGGGARGTGCGFQASFVESDHLDGDVDMCRVLGSYIGEQERRNAAGESDARVRLPFRPDHGHAMIDDLSKDDTNPGYTCIGRLRGLAELRGVETALRHQKRAREATMN